jgi:hypothetical protein
MGDSELPEPTYPMTSLGVSRRTQVVRHHHMAVPRRRLSGGTADGKAVIPAKTVLQRIADILKAPGIQAGVVQGPAAMHNLGTQVTEEEEGKSNAAVPKARRPSRRKSFSSRSPISSRRT